MAEVILSNRMQALTDMVTPGTVITDVGCDHGFVSVYLVQRGLSPRVIAMDVRSGPLERAREHIREYGLQERLEEINTQLVALSRQAVGDQALVAGDMTMTGQQLFPMGELLFEELVDVYKEQASVLAKAGVDLFVVETMMSLQECRAAVIAIREVCDLPIMVTLTYNEDGRTLFGTPPETAVVVLQSLGVDAIGVNCSTGPMEMVPLVEKMAEYATIPLIAKPNAGLPELEGGTGKSGSSHCRWMLRYNGKAYQGTFGCNAGDGTSQAACIASQDSCV